MKAAAPLLAELFHLSAQRCHGTAAGSAEDLALLETLDVPGMAGWLTEYRRQGCPPVHHSQVFRDAYRPHYRLLRTEYAGYFTVLSRIAALAACEKPAIVAMAFELAAYGASVGFLYSRSKWQCVLSLYRSLAIVMLGGRVLGRHPRHHPPARLYPRPHGRPGPHRHGALYPDGTGARPHGKRLNVQPPVFSEPRKRSRYGKINF